jgi:ATP-dependent RNA helicase DDX51/DBP6
MPEAPAIKAGVSKVSLAHLYKFLIDILKSILKTKAKTRYLKRKKIRRKARKSAAPRKTGEVESSGSEDEDDEPQEPEDEDDLANDVESEEVRGEERLEGDGQPISRPKKMRKVVEQADSEVGNTEIRHEELQPPGVQKPLSKPQGTLPSFPLPALPNAPPKSVLAMQGLDKALIHAEVIDPSTMLPLSLSEEADDTGLGSRTRKRLLELGINELFAGQRLVTRNDRKS